MPRLFISHSSKNDDWAIALTDWLVREGWSGPDDIFLDLDPERGLTAGQRWAQALDDAATRCEAVLFLVSEEWLGSKWCADEYQLANKFNKKLFALLIGDLALERLPVGMSAQWQVVSLKGEPAERFITVHPRTQQQSRVYIAEAALTTLKRGLDSAGIGAETFELQPDPNGPFGWRAPYRGLEALEPEDAAVFFGRTADIVRGTDALRGLAARKPPRLLVILGASGAGKSSFLRAGIWPRLDRDDSQWLPLKVIRAGRGGAIEGSEGLLAAIEDVHRRFGVRMSRADLRDRLAKPETFVELLRALRELAARRALISAPPYPLPIICLDQAEELLTADAGAEGERLLNLVRTAMDADAALALATIRSDNYGLMQTAPDFAGVDQVVLSIGPVPPGEMGRLIREPAEILRRKAGPSAPVFDAAVVERLQAEIEGEADSLPLLAFVLQRLMREHEGVATIGLSELERTGGVAAAIESEAEAALADAGFGPNRAERRAALRSLFIPRLARIDRESKAPQRRVTQRSELPPNLQTLARALTERRLLVVKLAGETEGAAAANAATLEVAHEALLRCWPTLADLLAEDRDALLLIDGVLSTASDWDKAEAERKPDFLAHRGSRLADAQALVTRGPDWERTIAPARNYLAACQAHEATEREEKEAALAREQQRLAEIAAAQADTATAQQRTARLQQRGRMMLAALSILVLFGIGFGFWQHRANIARQLVLDSGQSNLLATLAHLERGNGNVDGGLRLAVHAVRLILDRDKGAASPAAAELTAGVAQSALLFNGNEDSYAMDVAFNPNDSRTVVALADGTAVVTGTVPGEPNITLSGHAGPVKSAYFSHDGSRIVTASYDETARVWDANSGKQIALLQGHDGHLNDATFSPDDTRVVTASDDKTARIWDAATGQQIMVLTGHQGNVESASYSSDGKRIVTASFDKTARVWDASTGTQMLSLQHAFGVWSARFSPDGSRIVTAAMQGNIWDAATGKFLIALRGHERTLTSAAFSSDGSRVVTASADTTVRIWDAATGNAILIMHGHEAAVWSASFSADGSSVLTSSIDKTVRLWNIDFGKAAFVLNGHSDSVNSANVSSAGRLVTASSDRTAGIWDFADNSWKETLVLRGHEDAVDTAAFSRDGSRVVTASADKTARIWDAATGNQLVVLSGHDDAVNSAEFSPDGSRVVTASSDKTARVWDSATGNAITILSGHDDAVRSAAFSPDGSHIVTASDDRTARIWNAATGKQIAVLNGHTLGLNSAAFSPDGRRIVTASADATARIWDASTGKEITALRGHGSSLWSASYSPNGMRIVTSSEDKTARIWDASTGKEILVLRGHTGLVYSAVFSVNNEFVVTASGDHTARIWDAALTMMSTTDLMTEACQRRLGGLTTLTPAEMHLAGYPDNMPAIDVCDGVGQAASK